MPVPVSWKQASSRQTAISESSTLCSSSSKTRKVPCSSKQNNKTSFCIGMLKWCCWEQQPVPPLAGRGTCLFHSVQKTIQRMKPQYQTANEKTQQSTGKWLTEIFRSAQGLFQQKNTHRVWWHMTELTKDEAGAHLLYFLLGPAGSKHHSRGRNTYPEGGNKLGLQCGDCHGTSPKQRTAAKQSLRGHFPYC